MESTALRVPRASVPGSAKPLPAVRPRFPDSVCSRRGCRACARRRCRHTSQQTRSVAQGRRTREKSPPSRARAGKLTDALGEHHRFPDLGRHHPDRITYALAETDRRLPSRDGPQPGAPHSRRCARRSTPGLERWPLGWTWGSGYVEAALMALRACWPVGLLAGAAVIGEPW